MRAHDVATSGGGESIFAFSGVEDGDRGGENVMLGGEMVKERNARAEAINITVAQNCDRLCRIEGVEEVFELGAGFD